MTKFLKNRCPLKSRRASRLTSNYQLALVRECLSLTRGNLHRISKHIARIKDNLKRKLSTDHLQLIDSVTNKAYERDFEKRKKKLCDKFEKLRQQDPRHRSNNQHQRPSTITKPILQLQETPLPQEAIDLLNLGPKFAITPKEVPKMDIITQVEKAALQLERNGEKNNATELRHKTVNILLNSKPPPSNLTYKERQGLSFFKKNEQLAVVPFDKGQGLVTIERNKLITKAEAEFQKTTMDTQNKTKQYEGKTQRVLRKLHKDEKLDDKTYKECYPSGSTTPTASVAIKAHKPAKDHPARVITSHINAPQEKISAHLNQILKPLIENSPYICKNSTEFVKTIKKLKLPPGSKMLSYDAEALFPSVPIKDCIELIEQKLSSDRSLKNRTKLLPTDIKDLLTHCLETTDFIFNNRHHTTNDSGPIGLSLMVTVSQIWMIHTIETAIHIAKQRKVPHPNNLTVYMDDCWGTINSNQHQRPGLRSQANQVDPAEAFNQCLNEVHHRVKFTREEEIDGKIAFLDVLVHRQDDGTLTTQIYRKPTNTNVILKPQSCHDPTIHEAIFKGKICRATRYSFIGRSSKKRSRFPPQRVWRQRAWQVKIRKDSNEIQNARTPVPHRLQRQSQQ